MTLKLFKRFYIMEKFFETQLFPSPPKYFGFEEPAFAQSAYLLSAFKP